MLHEKFDVWLRPKPVVSKVSSISCLCEKNNRVQVNYIYKQHKYHVIQIRVSQN